MPKVSLLALEFARDQFREVVSNLLDDPSDLLHPQRESEPGEEIAAYRRLSGDLGLDFDELVSRGTDHARIRLAKLETLTDPEKTQEYLAERARAPRVAVADRTRTTKIVAPRPGWPYRPLSYKPPGTIPHRT